MSVELDRECKNCGMKLKQHVSFSEENGRITIKVYRYKCPFCNALIKKPKAEEIRSGRRKKRAKKERKRKLVAHRYK